MLGITSSNDPWPRVVDDLAFEFRPLAEFGGALASGEVWPNISPGGAPQRLLGGACGPEIAMAEGAHGASPQYGRPGV